MWTTWQTSSANRFCHLYIRGWAPPDEREREHGKLSNVLNTELLPCSSLDVPGPPNMASVLSLHQFYSYLRPSTLLPCHSLLTSKVGGVTGDLMVELGPLKGQSLLRVFVYLTSWWYPPTSPIHLTSLTSSSLESLSVPKFTQNRLFWFQTSTITVERQ